MFGHIVAYFKMLFFLIANNLLTEKMALNKKIINNPAVLNNGIVALE